MTSHAKHLLKLLALATMGWTLPAQATMATAPADNSESFAPAESAVVLRLQTDDLRNLIKGIGQQLSRTPITGRYAGSIYGVHPFGPLGVHGIQYQFDLKSLDVTPAEGYIALAIRIENVQVMIDRVTFNHSESRWCEEVPLSSRSGSINVSAEATVVVQDRSVDLGVTSHHVGLSATNFHVGTPARCHAFKGFNWLIRHMTPWFASLIRDRVKESITATIVDAARRTVRSLNDVLQVSITLPFAAKPAPAFYATVSIWPANFEVRSGIVSFIMGADVRVDPDTLPGTSPWTFVGSDSTLETDFFDRSTRDSLPTYIGIKREFLSAVLTEANDKGLFNFRFDSSQAPEAAELLTAEILGNIIPDSKDRFAPGTDLTLVAKGARATNVVIRPQGPGGLPILTAKLEQLALGIEVAGVPYYHLVVNLDVLLQAGYDRSHRELTLGLAGVQATTIEHGFEPNLSPTPRDHRFSEEQFGSLIKVISAALEERSRRLVAIGLPSLDVAGMRLELLGSQLREDAVTLDGHIVEVAR